MYFADLTAASAAPLQRFMVGGMVHRRRHDHTRSVHPLHIYRTSFAHQSRTFQYDNRTEVAVNIGPGEHVAGLELSVSLATVRPGQAIELLRFVDTNGAGVSAITDLHSEMPELHLDVRTEPGSTVVVGRLEGDTSIGTRARISLKLFGGATKLSGTTPYLTSDLELHFLVLGAPDLPVLLTVNIPQDASPRSTQGNFALASPSQVYQDRRLTNIYYRTSEVRLTYRFGTNLGLTAPWISIGNVGLAAALVFLVLSVRQTIGPGDTFAALTAAFIGVAAVAWDLSKNLSNFSIYGITRSWIQWLVLLAQLVMLGLLGLAVSLLPRSRTDIATLQRGVLYFALASGAIAVMGLVLHSRGYWHGFQCDHEGCRNRFRIRRNRPECHYTGRVFCRQHIKSVCSGCAHAADLGRRSLRTVGDYGVLPTPCGVPDAQPRIGEVERKPRTPPPGTSE